VKPENRKWFELRRLSGLHSVIASVRVSLRGTAVLVTMADVFTTLESEDDFQQQTFSGKLSVGRSH